jgi:hypothetical protein
MNRIAKIKNITADELLLDDNEKSAFLVNSAYIRAPIALAGVVLLNEVYGTNLRLSVFVLKSG